MSLFVQAAPRLTAFHGQLNMPLGVFLASTEPVAIYNIGYSIRDTSGALYNPGTSAGQSGLTGWYSRLAVVRGNQSQLDSANFTADTLLSTGMEVLFDTELYAFAGTLSFAGGQTSIQTYRGEGLTILLAQPKLYGAIAPTPQIYLRLYGTQGAAGSGGTGGSMGSAGDKGSGQAITAPTGVHRL